MHLLLVEHNADDVAILQELFHEGKDVDVHWVGNGAEALDYLHRRGKYLKAPRPDVVMLELGMPQQSGYEVLKELKQVPKLKDIPVIALSTAHNTAEHAETADLGADMCFNKPKDLEGYETMVDHLMHEDFARLVKA